MSDFHTLQLSVRLNKLEEKIKNAKLVKFEKLPTEQCLATRKIIEYAKPTQVLGELVEEIPNQTNTDSVSENFDQEIHRFCKHSKIEEIKLREIYMEENPNLISSSSRR